MNINIFVGRVSEAEVNSVSQKFRFKLKDFGSICPFKILRKSTQYFFYF